MSAVLRILAADDELLARKRIARLLGSMPDVELLGVCETAEEVLERLRATTVDVLLLDIEMPGLSGLEAKALLPADGPYVIFATAHPQHALEAFEVGAIDYVLKPLEAGRLQKALDRARQQRAPGAPGSGPRRLPLSTRAGIILLDPTRISHAIIDGSLVQVHTPEGVLLTDLSLQELAERLPGECFERVHRRALLNLDQVELLEPTGAGGFVARTRNGALVPISRQAARRLRRRWDLPRS